MNKLFLLLLIPIYKKNGYKALIIDWKNCQLSNKNLSKELENFPQLIRDSKGNSIKIIWSNSLNFQKFQNFIHGEIDEKTFLNFINYEKKTKKKFLFI